MLSLEQRAEADNNTLGKHGLLFRNRIRRAEKLDDHHHSYWGLRVAERFEQKFGNGARVWENAEWIPQVDDFKNWILNAEAGASAPIAKSLDVRLTIQDTYNNEPAAGRLKNDLRLL